MTIVRKISTIATGTVFASSTSAVVCYSISSKSETTKQPEVSAGKSVTLKDHSDFSTWFTADANNLPDSYKNWF